MSYLRNKEAQNQKLRQGAVIIAVLILIVIFRAPVGRGFSAFAHGVAWPFLKAKEAMRGEFSKLGTDFASKESLALENDALKKQLKDAQLANLERDILFNDNVALRQALGRGAIDRNMIAGVILSKPNASPYDTLIIDIGTSDGLASGDMVFADNTVPIGTIDSVYGKSALVKLFSTSGLVTKVVTHGGIYIDATGQGGGNFQVTLPRDVAIAEGNTLSLPNLVPEVLATVTKIVSDPRDPFQKILAISPVNIQELKFVEVERQCVSGTCKK
jgi:cell shape-determining protein MreC